jgi:hypothetical protein
MGRSGAVNCCANWVTSFSHRGWKANALFEHDLANFALHDDGFFGFLLKLPLPRWQRKESAA